MVKAPVKRPLEIKVQSHVVFLDTEQKLPVEWNVSPDFCKEMKMGKSLPLCCEQHGTYVLTSSMYL